MDVAKAIKDAWFTVNAFCKMYTRPIHVHIKYSNKCGGTCETYREISRMIRTQYKNDEVSITRSVCWNWFGSDPCFEIIVETEHGNKLIYSRAKDGLPDNDDKKQKILDCIEEYLMASSYCNCCPKKCTTEKSCPTKCCAGNYKRPTVPCENHKSKPGDVKNKANGLPFNADDLKNKAAG